MSDTKSDAFYRYKKTIFGYHFFQNRMILFVILKKSGNFAPIKPSQLLGGVTCPGNVSAKQKHHTYRCQKKSELV